MLITHSKDTKKRKRNIQKGTRDRENEWVINTFECVNNNSLIIIIIMSEVTPI
jgi:hypothetical protein